MPKNTKSMHFTYWDLLRKGKSQVEIAGMYNISRQAVNKTIKAQNHKVMVRLLELARSIGALVEWQDGTKGVLTGIIPQLEDRICLILVDENDHDRVYYKNINDPKINDELINSIRTNLEINIVKNSSFEEILQVLLNR